MKQQFEQIRVIVLDNQKMNNDINISFHNMENETFTEKDVFSIRPALAVIKDTNILIETDCFMRIGDSVELDVYQDTFDTEQNKIVGYSVVPHLSISAGVEGLVQAYGTKEISLYEFMGNQFEYNNRVKENMKLVIEELSK
jgi:hypothetical protein